VVEWLDVVAAGGVEVDVPADLPSWFLFDGALMESFRKSGGRGMVGFKEAHAPHLSDTGYRSPTGAASVRAGLQVVCFVGGEVNSYFRGIGGASIRIDPRWEPVLRRSPLIDYIEPNVSFTIG